MNKKTWDRLEKLPIKAREEYFYTIQNEQPVFEVRGLLLLLLLVWLTIVTAMVLTMVFFTTPELEQSRYLVSDILKSAYNLTVGISYMIIFMAGFFIVELIVNLRKQKKFWQNWEGGKTKEW